MILLEEQKDFTLKHIDYDLLQIIIRGLKHEKNNIQENINLLVVENMTTPEVSKLNKPQIEFMKSIRTEIDKLIEDYDKMNK